MKTKMFAIAIQMLLIISILTVVITTADEPQWPTTTWVPMEDPPDGVENAQKAYRDVYQAYYSIDSNYLYLRLECYGAPDFSLHHEARYKWFIDTDDPHNMNWSGGNVVGGDFLLFVEDTDDDGLGDIYLLNDIDGNGEFDEWEPPNNYYSELITDTNIANYSIEGNNISLWIKLENMGISEFDYAYFTWSSDNGNDNINQAPTLDRSDIFVGSWPKADLGIIKEGVPDSVEAGDYLTYTIYVTNSGPDTAINVNVTDYLPDEVTFVSQISGSDGYNNNSDGSIHWWTYSSLIAGGYRIITVNVHVDSGAIDSIINNATAYSETYDSALFNNKASCVTPIVITTMYNLDIIIDGSGSVTKNPDGSTFLDGTVVELTAVADPGWTFSGWSGDLSGSSNPETITMDENKSVTATFTEDCYMLVVNVVGNGYVTRDPDLTCYTYGSLVELSAVADPGWTFSGWSGDLSGSADLESITMDETKSVTATFTEDCYTLTVSIVGNGSLTKDPYLSCYTYGTDVELTAVSDPGWTFSHWEGDLDSTNSNENILINSNKNVIAYFTEDNYTLNITIIGHGSVSKNPDQNNYTYETNVELTASASSGYRFDYWSGDLTGTSKTAIINMTGNKTVTAHFVEYTRGGGDGGGIPTLFSSPTADPNGPYFGVPGEEIHFNGSKSHDNDEGGISIVTYDWKFSDEGEWYVNSSPTPVYIYNEPGVYNVTLRVYDNEGESDINITTATIVQPNRDPSDPQITGPENGTQNTTYTYFAVSTDEDGDSLSYVFDWDDGTEDSTEFLSTGIEGSANHIWYEAGIYTISVHAFDGESPSGSTELTILIDVLYVKDIGYLIDNDSDGIYDDFFSNSTNNITSTKQRNDGQYLINDDEDEGWDWIYDPDTDTLEPYTPPKEEGFNLLWLLALLLIIFILLIYILAKRRKKKEDAPPAK